VHFHNTWTAKLCFCYIFFHILYRDQQSKWPKAFSLFTVVVSFKQTCVQLMCIKCCMLITKFKNMCLLRKHAVSQVVKSARFRLSRDRLLRISKRERIDGREALIRVYGLEHVRWSVLNQIRGNIISALLDGNERYLHSLLRGKQDSFLALTQKRKEVSAGFNLTLTTTSVKTTYLHSPFFFFSQSPPLILILILNHGLVVSDTRTSIRLAATP
jgi:hypothetical protein